MSIEDMQSQVWWCRPLIPTHQGQGKQVSVNSMAPWSTFGDPGQPGLIDPVKRKKETKENEEMAQWVKHLLCSYEGLSSNPQLAYKGRLGRLPL